jgi:hypothetical protein
MKLPRRYFLHLAAVAAVLPAISHMSWAQAYPTRPVRVIVPPWLWTFAYGTHRDYSTTYGYAVDRDEAMKAFAKAWRGGDRQVVSHLTQSAGAST